MTAEKRYIYIDKQEKRVKVLLIGSAVIGLFSCIVFAIGNLIVYLKKKFGKE